MAFLVRDYVVNKLLKQIVVDFKKEFGKEITIEEAYEIVNSQFEIFPDKMNLEECIKLDHLGKFMVKPGRKDALLKSNEEFKRIYDEKPFINQVKVSFKLK